MRRATGIETIGAIAPPLPVPDPTLQQLAPQRSRVRSVVLFALVLVFLGAVWWSPRVLRPAVVGSDGNGGLGSASTSMPAWVASTPIQFDGWPSVEVVGVGDVPGAEVVGAWLLADQPISTSSESGPETSTLDFARNVVAPAELDDSAALPVRVDPDGRFQLVVLWEVTDCSALPDMFDGASIEVTVIPGLERDVRVSLLTPDEATLDDLGHC